MPKKGNGHYHVYCYLCGHRIEVSRKTMSTSCPGCHKPVIVEDIVVKGYKGVNNVETCGRLVVTRRGHVVAKKRIVAHGGIELEGRIQCAHAISAGPVVIGAKAEWRGDLQSPLLAVHEGARIHSGYFEIPFDPLEENRHPDDAIPAPRPLPPPPRSKTRKAAAQRAKPTEPVSAEPDPPVVVTRPTSAPATPAATPAAPRAEAASASGTDGETGATPRAEAKKLTKKKKVVKKPAVKKPVAKKKKAAAPSTTRKPAASDTPATSDSTAQAPSTPKASRSETPPTAPTKKVAKKKVTKKKVTKKKVSKKKVTKKKVTKKKVSKKKVQKKKKQGPTDDATA